MKKLLMFVFVAMLAIGSCFAQQRDPAARLKAEIDGLKAALTLTDAQLAKVTPIVTEGMKKRTELREKMAGGDREKMREEFTKLQTETDKAIKAVVTADQATKLDAFRKKQAEERAAAMQNR